MNEEQKLLKDISERVDKILEEVSEIDNEVYILQMKLSEEGRSETGALSMESEDSP